MTSQRILRAPAKINLTLHVLGRRLDGFHELDGFVAFAGVGDILEFNPNGALTLDLAGPTAEAAGANHDNLVLRAAMALAERVDGLALGRFRLWKRLPVAAGLGGGSSDAAAALRLLATEAGLPDDDPRIMDAAASVGSDVPVCLAPRARRMSGRGETLGPRIALPGLAAVLVNPRVPLSTAKVFAGLALRLGQATGLSASPAPPMQADAETAIAALASGRNDLQNTAIAAVPEIADVLAALSKTREIHLARMSGSGPTCFGLYATRIAARKAAAELAKAHPDWWVRATSIA